MKKIITNKLTIRDVTIKDREILALICESNIELYDSIMPGAFLKQAKKFRKNLPQKYNILIIELQDKVIGFIGVLTLSKESIYLVALYLHKNYQRKGLGTLILNKLKEKYRNEKFEEIILLVHKMAYWAKEFYIKEKFEIIANTQLKIQKYKNGLIKELYLKNTELMRFKL